MEASTWRLDSAFYRSLLVLLFINFVQRSLKGLANENLLLVRNILVLEEGYAVADKVLSGFLLAFKCKLARQEGKRYLLIAANEGQETGKELQYTTHALDMTINARVLSLFTKWSMM